MTGAAPTQGAPTQGAPQEGAAPELSKKAKKKLARLEKARQSKATGGFGGWKKRNQNTQKRDEQVTAAATQSGRIVCLAGCVRGLSGPAAALLLYFPAVLSITLVTPTCMRAVTATAMLPPSLPPHALLTNRNHIRCTSAGIFYCAPVSYIPRPVYCALID